MEEIKDRLSLTNEMLRKTIHLSSSLIPISYFFLSGEAEIIILCVMSVIMIIIDLNRTHVSWLESLYMKYLQPILRSHEAENKKPVFTGGTYLILAFLICVILFPKPIAITSMFIIVVSDSAAAIAGKIYGKHFIGNKTFEGSLAFFITGTVIILLTPKFTDNIIEYYTGVVTVLLTSVFELLPLNIDDNISIPIFFGAVYYLLLKIFIISY